MLSNKELNRLYRRYNRRYFGGRLPSIPVRFANTHGNWGYTHFEAYKPAYIVLNDLLRRMDSTCKFTLLHELCHVACPYRVMHGPRFDREMLRLARLGAFHGLW